MHFSTPLSIIALSFFLTACTDSSAEIALSSKAPKVTLSDEPPADGSCVGWRRSLSRGRHLGDVERCLREMALRDRPAAVGDARVMSQWDIHENGYPELKPLIAALVHYPEPGSLEAHLDSLALMPNEPGPYSHPEKALTASDFIRAKGNIHWFDTETGMFPNEHDVLLSDVAALSDLRTATFSEIPPSDFEADDEPYGLVGVVDDKTYRQQAENYGDWYDLSAVLMLLNRMAQDRDLKTRFVTLPTGDQTAIIWAVDDDVLTPLMDEGLIALSPDEVAMKSGKAFEAEVREKLGAAVE